MKIASIVATNLLTGMALLALSGSGIVVPAAAAEDPSPVAGQDSESAAQNEAETADVAAQDKAANASADEEVDLAAMQRAGYKIVNKNGVDLYCKKENILGSRLRTKTRCLTAAEMEQERTAASNAIADLSRAAQNLPGD